MAGFSKWCSRRGRGRGGRGLMVSVGVTYSDSAYHLKTDFSSQSGSLRIARERVRYKPCSRRAR
jgi:hypothetical protein